MKTVIKTFDGLSKEELYDIIHLRLQVFAVEQQIACQDLDYVDQDALHVWIEDEGKMAAYARVYAVEGGFVKIGRVASALEFRGKGYGMKVMKESIRLAEERFPSAVVLVHAQSYAKGFYEKLGFRITSEKFMEEGIEHYEMQIPPER